MKQRKKRNPDIEKLIKECMKEVKTWPEWKQKLSQSIFTTKKG